MASNDHSSMVDFIQVLYGIYLLFLKIGYNLWVVDKIPKREYISFFLKLGSFGYSYSPFNSVTQARILSYYDFHFGF